MPDKQLAEIWLNALQQSDRTTAENKLGAKMAKRAVEFDRVQQQAVFRPLPAHTLGLLSGSSFNWENYDYDIFWCEKSGDKAKRLATQIVNEMQRQSAKGRLRVRLLPEKVNARAGYGVSGFEIHRNQNELKQAEALQTLGNKILGSKGKFEIGLTSQSTSYYLSAFLCP